MSESHVNDLELQDLNANEERKIDFTENEEMDKYWFSYNSDCRLGAIIINTLRFIFELKSIIYPIEGSNEREVNFVYLVITFVIFAILALSFKKEYGVKFSYFSIILILIRIPFPLLDFENVLTKNIVHKH